VRTGVTVVGSLNLDLSVRVAEFARAGETVPGTDLQESAGGKGANQAVAAARLGTPTRLIGAVGDDGAADIVLKSAVVSGVDISGVRRVQAPTGRALIELDSDGENRITIIAGANATIPADSFRAQTFHDSAVVSLVFEIPIASSLLPRNPPARPAPLWSSILPRSASFPRNS
jgi:ribokinase